MAEKDDTENTAEEDVQTGDSETRLEKTIKRFNELDRALDDRRSKLNSELELIQLELDARQGTREWSRKLTGFLVKRGLPEYQKKILGIAPVILGDAQDVLDALREDLGLPMTFASAVATTQAKSVVEKASVSRPAAGFLKKVFRSQTVDFPASLKDALIIFLGRYWPDYQLPYRGSERRNQFVALGIDLRSQDGRFVAQVTHAIEVLREVRLGNLKSDQMTRRTANLYLSIGAADEARWQIIEATVANWFEGKSDN